MVIKELGFFMYMKLVGIDVGYKNIGLVMADCQNEKVSVEFFKRINISILDHNRVSFCNCKIPHTNELSDLIAHFVQEYKEIFDAADQIIVERQPPGGLTNVETLLHYIFRDKVILVSPVSMHKHFGMGHLDYDNRKIRTEEIAGKYMDLSNLTRKHDVADAFCMIMYQNFLNRKLIKKQSEKNPFESYRFNN